MGKILVKRIYEPVAKSDGFRILVDRLWPRGLPKQAAQIDLWLRDIGPSTALLATINQQVKTGPVTLLYSAKDEQHNQAEALLSFLTKPLVKTKPTMRPKSRSHVIPIGKKMKPCV